MALGRPVINGIKEIWFRDDRRAVFARREAPGGGWETYELPLPAVLGVKEGLNLPRYPSVPGRLRAKKKEIERVELGVASGRGSGPARTPPAGGAVPGPTKLGFGCRRRSGPPAEVIGRGPEAAPAVVDLLERIGVLAK